MSIATRFPTSNATETGAGLTNPNNAHADDGVNYATALPGKNTTLATRYGGFGFDTVIPSNATISKVEILYQYKVSVNTSIATARTYSKVATVAQANHDDTTEQLSDTTNTVDITADRSWTRANLLDGTLEVVLSAVQGNSGTAVTFSFDFVQARVTFTDAWTQGSYTYTGNDIGLTYVPKPGRTLTNTRALASGRTLASGRVLASSRTLY